MQYCPGNRIGELVEYTLPGAWLVFVSSSKQTFLFPPAARQLVQLIRQSEGQHWSGQELRDIIKAEGSDIEEPEELLSSLVQAGILLCR